MSDRASKALAEASLPGEPQTYDARSKRSGVPLTTLYYREHGRPSKEEKAQGQQYLTPSEEKALKKYLKLIADLGNPVRIKCLPALAFSIARQRSTNKAAKPPGKNWPRGFQKRHPALKSQSGYTDSKISLEWLKRVFNPQTREQANQKPQVLICDGFT
jgi:hypothetical protein